MFAKRLRYSALLAAMAAAAVLTGCQGISPAPPPVNPGGDLKSVNHIIFMAQENRGFDHYFGKELVLFGMRAIAFSISKIQPQANHSWMGLSELQGSLPKAWAFRMFRAAAQWATSIRQICLSIILLPQTLPLPTVGSHR